MLEGLFGCLLVGLGVFDVLIHPEVGNWVVDGIVGLVDLVLPLFLVPGGAGDRSVVLMVVLRNSGNLLVGEQEGGHAQFGLYKH